MNDTNRAPYNAICHTCGRSASAPYRRHVDGRIVEGCVDAIHGGHLIGESARWHTTLAAYQIRENGIAMRGQRTAKVYKRAPRGTQSWVGTLDGRLIASAGDPAEPYAAEVF